MPSDLHLCRRLRTVSADFRQDLQQACPRCQGSGDVCLVALMTAALHARDSAEATPAVLPLPDETP